jgi:hypothetical protein
MSKKDRRRVAPPTAAADVQVPFKFRIIHGQDPSRKSGEQKAVTRALTLGGLVFESKEMVRDGLHLSFTESSFGRNTMEITLDLGKKFRAIEILGEVDCYELRSSSAAGETFLVGISFTDIQADDLAVLREFLGETRRPAG